MGRMKDFHWDEICDGIVVYQKPQVERTPVQKMKDYLGENWVLHPNYKFRPRHSNDVTIWQKHSILSEVRAAAVAAGRLS